MSDLPSEWILVIRSAAAEPGHFALKPGRNTIGRSRDSDIVIADAAASRDHAEVIYELDDASLTIRDLGSLNGTYVNHERLIQPRRLAPNDAIRIGQVVLTVTNKDRQPGFDYAGVTQTEPLTQNLLLESLGQQVQLLYEVATKLNTVLDIDVALQEVSGLMRAAMGADKCMVILAEQFDRVQELGFPTSIAEQAISKKAAVVLPVVPADPGPLFGKSAALLRVRSALCVPVINGDEVLALLYAYKTDPESRPFDQGDLQVAVAISHQAALTLQRAFLVRQAEQALRASEQRFRSVVNSSPDIIYTVDLETHQPTLLNREEFFGYSKEEFESRSVHLLTAHPEDAAALGSHWRALASPRGQNRVDSIEYRLLTKEGACEWVQSRDTVFEYDAAGRPKQILVSLTVITERKQAQERLRKSEMMLAEAQQLAQLGSWDWAVDAGAVTGSEQFYRMYALGRPEGGVAFEDLLNRVHPADRVRTRRLIQSAYRSHKPFTFHHRLVREDGAIQIHEVRGWVVASGANGVVRMFGTVQDVTELKQAERAMKRRSDELAMINAIVTSINESLDLSTILAPALKQIATLLAVDGAECHLLDRDARLQFAAQHGLEPAFVVGSGNSHGSADEAINGQALAGHRPVFVPDVQGDSRYGRRELARAAGYRSALCVPIVGPNGPMGTFTLYSHHPRAYSPELSNSLLTAGAQLGVAIERAELYELQRQRTAQLTRSSALITALSRVAARLQTTMDPDSVIATLGTELKRLDVLCFVFMLEPGFGALVVRYSSIEPPALGQIEAVIGREVGGFRVPPDLFPHYGQIIEHGRSLFLPDTASLVTMLLHDLPDETAARVIALAGMPPDAPLLHLPLAVEERVLGILAMVGPGLQEDDVPAFSAFGGQVAIALDNARLFEEVRTSRERLRQLAKQALSAQEDERQRVSRELHDEAGQALTALKISLELMQNDLPAEFHGVRQRLGEAVALTDSTMQGIRLLAQALRPPSIDALDSINLSLDSFCREFAGRTQLPIGYVGAQLPRLSDQVNICLYRFLQEALTNVAKHAQAKHVWVALHRDGEVISLSVEDDGKGLDWRVGAPSPDRHVGLGVMGMQERIELLGGWLEIESEPGRGTRLTAHLPFLPQAADTKEPV